MVVTGRVVSREESMLGVRRRDSWSPGLGDHVEERTPSSGDERVGSDQILRQPTFNELTMTFGPCVTVVLDDYDSARQDRVDLAVNNPPLPSRVIHVHVMLVVDTDLGLGVWIPDNHIGVATGCDHTFLGVHPEHACRCGATGLDPSFEGQFAGNNTLVDQLHAMLDAADAIRDR